MVQQFNGYYNNIFEHGWNVTVDERIIWGWARDQLGGGHRVDIKPRGFGPKYKCLFEVTVQVTTTFENIRSKEVKNKRKYNKEHGAGAASVLSLCEASGIEGSNCSMISYSWFGGIGCILGLSKLGLQDITTIKTRTAG